MTSAQSRAVRRWSAVLLVVALVGCSTSPPSVTPPNPGGDLIIDRAATLVLKANTIYEEVVIQSSRAYFAGELDGDTFNTIKKAAENVERSLRAAKAGVEVYAIVRSSDNAVGATALLDALQVVSDELDRLWKEESDGE